MSLIAGIIGGAVALGSSLFGMKASSDANKSSLNAQRLANQGNIELARENNNFNLEMWRRNNEYNSPASQMQRYKDAGLNPALIYGSSGNAGNSSSPVTGTVARISALPARDLTGVANYLGQGLDSLVNLAGKLEDIKSKKLNNSILRYKEKYSDSMLQEGLNQVILGNQYAEGSLQSRLNSSYWDSIYKTSLAKEKQNYVNDWQSRFLAKQLESLDAGIGLTRSRTGLTSWQSKLARENYNKFLKDIPLFDKKRSYEMNNIDFVDKDLWRGIDKGMNILSGLIDIFASGVSGYGKLKGILHPNRGKLKSSYTHTPNTYSETEYEYE